MRKFLSALALALPLLAQNAALPPDPHQRFLDASGRPLAGGKVYTCQAGLACPGNPLATYTDATATVQNPNPVILDSSGYASLWIGTGSYKFVVQNASGVQQWVQDNVTNSGLVVANSLNGTNGAGSISYTPPGTGGLTRTLQAMQGDVIDAASYDTLSNAFAAACASTPGKAVVIPASVGSGGYTNSCKAPVYDQRIGTSASPTTGRTFWTPSFGGTFYDASPRTTDSAAQGDAAHSPVVSIRLMESGGATAPALYTEYRAIAGATGGAYGSVANVSADPGSVPLVVAHNWTIQDATHYWITGCTRTSNSATCTIATGGSNPPFSLLDSNSVQHCFYVTNTADSTFAKGGALQCPSSTTSGSVTFSNSGADTTSGAGGWLSPSHQVFGFELNSNNASHDPGHITPAGGGALPVWGFVSQNTPFTWTNPTGGSNIANLPLSAGFFAAGSSNSASGAQYIGFLGQDALDDIFVAGYPLAGGSVSAAKSGFRARPIAAATSSNNYRSQYSCWDDSVWNGTSTYNETSYCMGFVPGTGANAESSFQFFQKGWETTPINFFRQGHLTVDGGNSTSLAYGFNGWTNGLYNSSGVTAVAGGLRGDGVINAVGGFQSNGTVGLSATVTVRNSANTGSCVMTFTGGLLTATSGC